MAQIKTALDLALERTAGLKADKSGLEQSEAKKAGRMAAAKYLENPTEIDLKKELNKQKSEFLGAAREGAVEAILSYAQLPRDKESMPALDKIAAGLNEAAAQGLPKQAKSLLDQLGGFMEQYLKALEQMEEALRRQYAPKLKQKEQEMARRTGQEVKLDPLRDPEFINFYTNNMNQLKAQYQGALTQAKEDLKNFILSEK
jgi:HrpA-like RNA helicase